MFNSFFLFSGIVMDYFWSGWVSVLLDNMLWIFIDNKVSGNNLNCFSGNIGYVMGYCGLGVFFVVFVG